MTAEFRAYLEDAYGYDRFPEEQATLCDAAWFNGHASGYHEVETHYNDYANLSEEELAELDY